MPLRLVPAFLAGLDHGQDVQALVTAASLAVSVRQKVQAVGDGDRIAVGAKARHALLQVGKAGRGLAAADPRPAAPQHAVRQPVRETLLAREVDQPLGEARRAADIPEVDPEPRDQAQIVGKRERVLGRFGQGQRRIAQSARPIGVAQHPEGAAQIRAAGDPWIG